ncbi:N-formylglutamate amidohydrolase [Paucihalobacter ruber]|uniref:N-formylglutamate amidohydrolase n=1 Tax=Paucihalobacter ruber TaxID=2567861 RepID=A0A506PJA7_9FLAO|nr:N-formylglutamate amidohydrolase [Paucihalobacter ruber]TPV33455.1 N-formylglutamate amidohydrolase [Paucihalobacter ruber]
MEKLSVEAIIAKINRAETFSAVAEDYSFTLKIETYVPFMCAAIHDGHQFRRELWDNCLHTEYDRWYEEDPETKYMINTQPIVLAGLDSRFEYDLNRPPEEAVFETAWGKQLWRNSLQIDMKQRSLDKHNNFYKVVDAVIAQLELQFTNCIVYDMHSYNWQRWDREVPTWNLGTTNIDNDRFGKMVEVWRKSLSEIKLPNNIKSTAKINDTFFGNGYFLKHITSNFKNTLVLATEIAKVYCDEYKQVIYPQVVESVRKALQIKIPEHAESFNKTFNH